MSVETIRRILRRPPGWRCRLGWHKPVLTQRGSTASGDPYRRTECERGCGAFWWTQQTARGLSHGSGRDSSQW